MGRADDDANAVSELRLEILNSSPSDLGIDRLAEDSPVWGVVVDWPVSEQIATVVALASGDASLYTTSTFGVIGGGGHEPVRAAALRVVSAAAQDLPRATEAEAFPYPGPGQVYFYFLTYDGVCAATAEAAAIEAGTDPLTSLFGLTQDLLTELRLIEDSGRSSREITRNDQPEREWFGLPGYLNCLLTGMSRGMGPTIHVDAKTVLPNLEECAASHPKLQAWIAAQEFDYGGLRAADFIDLLKNSVPFRGLPFAAKKGEFKTIHAQEDGAPRARVFDLILARGDRAVTITMAADDDPRVVAMQERVDRSAS